MLAPCTYLSICQLCCVNLFCPESMLEVSKRKEGGVGTDGLAAAVPPCVRLTADCVLHLLELHVGYGDGWWPSLLESGLLVEGHQEFLANQQSSAEAWYTAQVLQVAPQEDGALALLSTVTVHWQHMDVHSRAVWDMLSHCLLEKRDYREGIDNVKATMSQNSHESEQFSLNDQLAWRRNIGLLYSFYVSSYLWEPLLAPARADDESYQLSLLKPTQWQLRALTQEVKHFIQGKWTLSRHRDKCWGCKEKQLIQWVMSWEPQWWRSEKEMCCTQGKTGTIFNIQTIFKRFIDSPMTELKILYIFFLHAERQSSSYLLIYKGLKQVTCILFVNSRSLIYLLSLSQTHWWHPVAWGFWTRWRGVCVVSVAGDWRVSSERRAWKRVSRWPAVSWCLNNTRIGSEYLSEVFCPLIFQPFAIETFYWCCLWCSRTQPAKLSEFVLQLWLWCGSLPKARCWPMCPSSSLLLQLLFVSDPKLWSGRLKVG